MMMMLLAGQYCVAIILPYSVCEKRKGEKGKENNWHGPNEIEYVNINHEIRVFSWSNILLIWLHKIYSFLKFHQFFYKIGITSTTIKLIHYTDELHQASCDWKEFLYDYYVVIVSYITFIYRKRSYLCLFNSYCNCCSQNILFSNLLFKMFLLHFIGFLHTFSFLLDQLEKCVFDSIISLIGIFYIRNSSSHNLNH